MIVFYTLVIFLRIPSVSYTHTVNRKKKPRLLFPITHLKYTQEAFDIFSFVLSIPIFIMQGRENSVGF